VLGERYGGTVVEGVCNRADVLAYFASRSEREIVIDPARVVVVKRERLRLVDRA
jgi:hypothetical protein